MTTGPSPWAVAAIALVVLGTVLPSLLRPTGSRTTSDFFVASRRVGPRRNAAAISGEYLSAASFLGAAGLIYTSGVDLVWLPVGYTVGFVVLLLFVAAPLRRSGAYTLPDFAEARLESRLVRLVTSVLVVAVGWLYLVAQLVGASVVLTTLTGAPRPAGALLVAVVVAVVASGGMRSVTGIQAAQYFVKLACLAVPVLVLLGLWARDGLPAPRVDLGTWGIPFSGGHDRAHPFYSTGSMLLAFALGTMGLPHVVIRYYTNRDGTAARRTTVTVVALLGLFYVLVPPLGVLGAVYLPALPAGASHDTMPLLLPGAVLPGLGGELLTALLAGGAFIAFCSTACGLTVAVAGVLEQDLVGAAARRVLRTGHSPVLGFRLATLLALVVPLAALPLLHDVAVARLVELAFTLTAATLSLLLLLGVWWPRLSRTGALAGLVTGTLLSGGAPLLAALTDPPTGWPRDLLTAPTAWAVPTTAAVVVAVSLLTPRQVPRGTTRTLVRLHTPEAVHLDRSR